MKKLLLIALPLLFCSKTAFAPHILGIMEQLEEQRVHEERIRKEAVQKAFAQLAPMMAQAHKMSSALTAMQACAYANPLGNQSMLVRQQALATQMAALNSYVKKAAGITDAKPGAAAAADAKQNGEGK